MHVKLEFDTPTKRGMWEAAVSVFGWWVKASAIGLTVVYLLSLTPY